jgi:hypothetical protein
MLLFILSFIVFPFACNETKQTDTAVTIPDTRFALPLADPSQFFMLVGVDHDEQDSSDGLGAECLDYQARNFPHCYDGHDGSDYLLSGSFTTMDAGSAEIISAAAGVVIKVVDGNYDRCHIDLALGGIDCDGHPMKANKVTIAHDNGYHALYAHMKKESIIVEEGQRVERGEVLGLVGSSGYSSAPHLHFEVSLPKGDIIDPYAGPLSQPDSLWCDQQDPFPGYCSEFQ